MMTVDAVGGVWNYAIELVRSLREFGTSTVLVVMGPPPSAAQRRDATSIPGLILQERPFRLEWMEDAAGDVQSAGDWLLSLEQRFRPSVVHLNGYAHAVLPWQAPCVVAAHSCVRSWWLAVKGEEIPDRYQDYCRMVTEGLRAATAIVAPSKAFLQTLEQLYGPLPRARVILNGRDPAAFRPARKKQFVLGAGRLWDEGKNIAALEAAAENLSWPVCLAGQLEGRGLRHVAKGRIVYLGALEQKEFAARLSQAAIFAAPARYEPFGLAVLEAGLSGCALVLANIPTFRELWSGAAVFIEPKDHRSLRHALVELTTRVGATRRLGETARLRANQYTHTRMAAGYSDLYRELLAVRAKAAIDAEDDAGDEPHATSGLH